ncbi:inner membrane magnesium transporter mrs2,mitochondrial precursor [Alternaria alternata]|nr:inner membrane magnesium transporter mrs2,mitochondrial precursor [Alternaria alternata]
MPSTRADEPTLTSRSVISPLFHLGQLPCQRPFSFHDACQRVTPLRYTAQIWCTRRHRTTHIPSTNSVSTTATPCTKAPCIAWSYCWSSWLPADKRTRSMTIHADPLHLTKP